MNRKPALMDIITMTIDPNIETTALLRLLHLVSPSLPTGGFAYSQGLEWAVESGWIKDADTLENWLENILNSAMVNVDIALFSRLYQAAAQKKIQDFSKFTSMVIACRETSELRMEEKNRGRAMASILKDLDIRFLASEKFKNWFEIASTCQLAGFAVAAAEWKIPSKIAAAGYLWAWLENQVLSGIKIIPLGQTAGQKILKRLAVHIEGAVSKGIAINEEDIGASLPALSIGSSCHETQYTRLFRS